MRCAHHLFFAKLLDRVERLAIPCGREYVIKLLFLYDTPRSVRARDSSESLPAGRVDTGTMTHQNFALFEGPVGVLLVHENHVLQDGFGYPHVLRDSFVYIDAALADSVFLAANRGQ
eukprot:COSAG02_NODE_209_length_28965_cov_18.680143_28_plen_117_part_00